ncbi:MAG: hypothetical protein ACYTGV_13885 [Planctomycetota bacterium]|jgi:hypothetical protein
MPRKNRKARSPKAGFTKRSGHQSGYLEEHNVKNSPENGRFVSTRRGPGRSRQLQGTGFRGAARGGGTAGQRGTLLGLAAVAGIGASVVSRNPRARRRASSALSTVNQFLSKPASEGGGTAMLRRRRRRGGL